MEITLSEPSGKVPLTLELRTTRGRSAADAPLYLANRVILGEPAVRRLTPDTASGDEELAAFLTAEAGHCSYWLIAFTCTFEHDDELPFESTWLRLALAADEGTAIAHSMEPQRLAYPRAAAWSIKLTVPCILMQTEIGVSGELKAEEIFCEASSEGTANPTWKYYKTSSAKIRGLQRMHLVARTPVDSGLLGTVNLGARAVHERFGWKPLRYDTGPSSPRVWLHVPAPDA